MSDKSSKSSEAARRFLRLRASRSPLDETPKTATRAVEQAERGTQSEVAASDRTTPTRKG